MLLHKVQANKGQKYSVPHKIEAKKVNHYWYSKKLKQLAQASVFNPANNMAHIFAGPMNPEAALIVKYLSQYLRWSFESYS